MIYLDEFFPLKKIIFDTVQNGADKNILDIGDFVKNMEFEFEKLGYREKNFSSVKNILLIRLDAVGDFILTSPAIRAVRENFPAANITLIVSQKIFPLAELCPYVNEILFFNQNRDDSILKNFVDAAIFSEKYLWKKRFDVCICMGIVNNAVRNFLTYLSGANERVAYHFDELGKIMNNRCIDMEYKYSSHDCFINLYLLKAYGLKIKNTDLEVWFDKTDIFNAKNILKNFGENRIKIAVGIGATDIERKYPVEKYLIAFKEIISKGASIIIFGGKNEIDDAKFLEKNLPQEYVKNFVKINAGWRVDVAAIFLSDIYIGNFTGTCDIASALKKPVIALTRIAKDVKNFYRGFNESELYYPFKTDSILLRPARQLDECRKNKNMHVCTAGKSHCIAQIDPSEIVDAFNKMCKFKNEIKNFGSDFEWI